MYNICAMHTYAYIERLENKKPAQDSVCEKRVLWVEIPQCAKSSKNVDVHQSDFEQLHNMEFHMGCTVSQIAHSKYYRHYFAFIIFCFISNSSIAASSFFLHFNIDFQITGASCKIYKEKREEKIDIQSCSRLNINVYSVAVLSFFHFVIHSFFLVLSRSFIFHFSDYKYNSKTNTLLWCLFCTQIHVAINI